MDDGTPRKIGEFKILERIGGGGMAEVFLGFKGQSGFEKQVAIKRILPVFAREKAFVTMFFDEARIAATLSHSNIVQIFELGESEGAFYIAMEHVKGVSLEKIASTFHQRGATLPPRLAAYVLCQVCAALEYAHTRRDDQGKPSKIVHRDISPSNVLVSFDGEVKLIDFGIALAAQRLYTTQVGTVKGKYGYMSPEQASGEAVDWRTDIFSAGIVLFELLTGQNPLLADSELASLERSRLGRVPSPSSVIDGVPPLLERICLRAVAVDPDGRYQSAAALERDLEQFLHGAPFSRQQLAAWIEKSVPDFQTGATAQAPQDSLARADTEYAPSNPDAAGATLGDSKALIGQVLHDAYRVESLISAGEQGDTYQAFNLKTNDRCSVKALSSRLLPSYESVARFKREAMVAYDLGHPHIVRAYDLNVTPLGTPYIVMEELQGESLGQRMERKPPLGLDEVVAILEQTGGALQQAHDRGVIHRNLQPENIFLCEQEGKANFVKVMGFGSAKLMKSLLKLTRTHATLGTPGYMAPEQVRGQAAQVDRRADIFSMGVVLYEMLTGTMPFGSGDVEEVLRRIAFDDPVHLSVLRPELPGDLDRVLLKAMAKAPGDRQRSMDELVQQVQGALASCSTKERIETIEWDPEAARRTRIAPTSTPVVQHRVSAAGAGNSLSKRTIAFLSLALLVCVGILAYGIWIAFIKAPKPRSLVGPIVHSDLRPTDSIVQPDSRPSPLDANPKAFDVGEPSLDKSATHRSPVITRPSGPKRARPATRRPGYGYLTVVTTYGEDDFWAHVYLDGKYLGKSVIYRKRIRDGTHVVRVKRLGYKPATKRFHLKAGQTRRIVLKLR